MNTAGKRRIVVSPCRDSGSETLVSRKFHQLPYPGGFREDKKRLLHLPSGQRYRWNKEAVRRDAAYPQPAGSILSAEQKAPRIFPESSLWQVHLLYGTYLRRSRGHPAGFCEKIPENDLSDEPASHWSQMHWRCQKVLHFEAAREFGKN